MGKYSYADASYFEKLVSTDLAQRFGVASNVSDRDLASSRMGAERNRGREELRAPVTATYLENHLRDLSVVVTRVNWVGGRRGADGSAVDLEVELDARKPVGYQLKSVKAGDGTMKNIGRDTIERWLKIDLNDLSHAALVDVVTALEPLKISGLDSSSFSALRTVRDRLHDDDPGLCDRLERTAKKAYEPHKYLMTKLLADAFNAAGPERRVAFVLNALSFVEDNEEYLLIHDDRGPHLFDVRALVGHVRSIALTAEVRPPGNSFFVLGDAVRLFRVNSSAANHQGLSTLCARAFFQGGGALLTNVPVLPPRGPNVR